MRESVARVRRAGGPRRQACREAVVRESSVSRRSAGRAKRGKRAGNDPWQANTLEWFVTSPPPENNFDVIPRVRSVEPMKDIRRQIEQQTGVPQQYQSGQALVRVGARAGPPAQQRTLGGGVQHGAGGGR